MCYVFSRRLRTPSQKTLKKITEVAGTEPSVQEFKEALKAAKKECRQPWACVRTAEGFGSLFDIFLGTREGGVESPILFLSMLFHSFEIVKLIILLELCYIF